jgi:hypothetical protein
VRVTRRWIAVVLAALVLMAAAAVGIRAAQGPHSPSTVQGRGPLIVIGAAGLDWQDVSPDGTPSLWSLLRRGTTAAMTVRSVQLNTCPIDGWLSLSAGQRAGDVGPGGSTETAVTASGQDKPACRALPHLPQAGPVTQVPRWDVWRHAATARPLDAVPGLLAQTLHRQGMCVQAIGPGAAIAAADPSGRVARYAPFGPDLPLSRCPVTIVDVGAVRDQGDVDPRDAVQPKTSHDDQVRRSNRRIAQVVAAAPEDARILVTGLADAGRSEHLRLVALAGPGIPAGEAWSSSTRQPGLVQASDVTATILAESSSEPRPDSAPDSGSKAGPKPGSQPEAPLPEAVSGAPLEAIPLAGGSRLTQAATQDRLQTLRDMGAAADEVRPLVGPFFVTWGLLQVVVYAIGAVLWRRTRRGSRRRQRIADWVAGCATVAAAVPVSTFLANALPWWRAGVPGLAMVGAVALFAGVIGAVALAGPWRRPLLGPAGVVSAATVIALALDVMTGSRLQLSSLLGEQPVVGGRFYGMGNVTFALFGTAALVLAVALAGPLRASGERRLAAATVVALGIAAVLVDGWPGWGADFGGPPALVPAFGFLLLAALGVRLTWRRAAAIVGATVGLLALLAVLDWLRPAPSRTHLGAFVQSVIEGHASEVVGRKLDQNVAILLSSPLTMAVPVGLAAAIYLVARPSSRPGRLLAPLEGVPLLRPGLVALAICWVIGFAANDSGTVIPAIGATLAIPLLIAVGVRRAAGTATPVADPLTTHDAAHPPAAP